MLSVGQLLRDRYRVEALPDSHFFAYRLRDGNSLDVILPLEAEPYDRL